MRRVLHHDEVRAAGIEIGAQLRCVAERPDIEIEPGILVALQQRVHVRPQRHGILTARHLIDQAHHARGEDDLLRDEGPETVIAQDLAQHQREGLARARDQRFVPDHFAFERRIEEHRAAFGLDLLGRKQARVVERHLQEALRRHDVAMLVIEEHALPAAPARRVLHVGQDQLGHDRLGEAVILHRVGGDRARHRRVPEIFSRAALDAHARDPGALVGRAQRQRDLRKGFLPFRREKITQRVAGRDVDGDGAFRLRCGDGLIPERVLRVQHLHEREDEQRRGDQH